MYRAIFYEKYLYLAVINEPLDNFQILEWLLTVQNIKFQNLYLIEIYLLIYVKLWVLRIKQLFYFQSNQI